MCTATCSRSRRQEGGDGEQQVTLMTALDDGHPSQESLYITVKCFCRIKNEVFYFSSAGLQQKRIPKARASLKWPETLHHPAEPLL